MERRFSPGKGTTEHKKANRAESLGILLIAAGVALGIDGAAFGKLLFVVLGLGLVAGGIFMVLHSSASYAKARAHVKAAAVAPPARHRGI